MPVIYIGGGPSDYLIDAESGAHRNAGPGIVTAWSAESGGTQYAWESGGVLRAGSKGRILRTGVNVPTGVTGAWLQIEGVSGRWWVEATSDSIAGIIAGAPESVIDGVTERVLESSGLVASNGERDSASTVMAWRLTETVYQDIYSTDYDSATDVGSESGRVVVLTPEGKVDPSVLPPLDGDGDYLRLDGTNTASTINASTVEAGAVNTSEVNVTEGRVGDILLRNIQGNGGNRLQVVGINRTGGYADHRMAYVEVEAAREGEGTDVGGAVGGYQAHWVGNGTTPSTADRLYWGVELMELAKKYFGRDDLGGAVQIFVSSRNGVPLRAMIFAANSRPAMTFHGLKPYVELMRNTASTLDDRAYPDATPGNLFGKWYFLYRRDGGLGVRYASYSNTEHSAIWLSRNRGTVAAPTRPASGDVLGAVDAGSTANTDPDYLHEGTFGGVYKNGRELGTQIVSTATEAWTASARGSQVAVKTVAAGTTTLVDSLTASEPTAAGQTSVLLRVNRDGTTTQTRVEVGAPDSGGPGKRALVIPN